MPVIAFNNARKRPKWSSTFMAKHNSCTYI
jgi:hypothetical protein